MAKGRVDIDGERCKGCRLCREACPRDLITGADEPNDDGYFPAAFRDDPEAPRCTACVACAMVCPEIAVRVYRRVDEET